MKRSLLPIALLCILATGMQAQSPFRSGNIVITRVGDGTTPLGFVGARIFLDEYTPTGVLVQSVPLPTADNGADKKIVLNDGDAATGTLTRSPDGRFLTLFGYNADVGAVGSTLVSMDKVVARIDYNGNVNTTTVVPGSEATSFAESAITNTGAEFWTVDASGLRYTTLGATSGSVSITAVGFRTVGIANNQLYVGSGSGTVRSIGTGLPTTGPQTPTTLPGFSNLAGFTHMFFADLDAGVPGIDVIYIAHENANAIKKFSLVSGTWVSNGIVGVDADDYRGITGVINGSTVTLYCTRKGGTLGASGGELVTLTDASGYNGALTGTPTVLVTASANTVIRGVAMAPQPLSISLSTKAFLSGDYNVGLGRHKDVSAAWASVLNANALSQPFSVAPFNYGGTENVAPGFFASTGATTDIVDWVLLELRDATTPATIIARQAAFIREDGKIVGLDGTSDPVFTGVGANNYYLVIRHRNHLGVRSSNTIFVNGATPVLYDFTTAQSKAFQNVAITTNAAMRDLDGGITFGLWGGNVNSNANVRYIGLQNDGLAILSALGSIQSAIISNAYNNADVNFDGTIKYIGLNNDLLAILSILNSNQSLVATEHQ